MTHLVAIDAGYGFTKAVGPTGRRALFPSVVGSPEDAGFRHMFGDLDTNGRMKIKHQPEGTVEEIIIDRQVGVEAIQQSEVSWSTQARKRADKDLFALVGAAMFKLGIEGNAYLVVGLPVDYYPEAQMLIKMLKGYWQVNGKETVVRRVAVLPQPVGTLYHIGLDMNGNLKDEGLLKDTFGVVDIGTHTTDGVVFREQVYQGNLRFTVTSACGALLEAIALHLNDKFYLDVAPHSLDRELRQKFAAHAGIREDLTRVIRQAVDVHGERILSVMDTRWGRVLGINRLVLTGGGAYYFDKVIEARYSHIQTVIEPEWANVLGFRKFAQWVFGSVT